MEDKWKAANTNYETDALPEARHTAEMQAILSNVPPRLMAWGLALFCSILILVIGLPAMITYPDLANATLTVANRENTAGQRYRVILKTDPQYLPQIHAGQQVLLELKTGSKNITAAQLVRVDTLNKADGWLLAELKLTGKIEDKTMARLSDGQTANANIVLRNRSILKRIYSAMLKNLKLK